MQLGLSLGFADGRELRDQVLLAQRAEQVGYSVVWTSEAYGCDSPTVLGYLAAKTERIHVGAAVMQIPARSPAMTAMTAATLDLLSGGRFRLGLGVSGPQVSEGWHGVRFDRPLARTREYVDVVALALQRREVRYDGEFYRLPLPNGPGKALTLSVRPLRDRVPLYLAAVGPHNLELAGELADGWLAIFFSSVYAAELMESVARGRERGGRADRPFDVAATVPVSIGNDVEACAEPIRRYAALYVGGMGSRDQNFYNRLACRMGFEAEAARVQDHFLAGRHREAMAAVPFDLIDQTSLIGPPGRVAERLQAFAEAGVTTLTVAPFGADLEKKMQTVMHVSEVLGASGLAD